MKGLALGEFMIGGGLLQDAGRNRVGKSLIHWAKSFLLEGGFFVPWEELSGDGLHPPPLNRGALDLFHEGLFSEESSPPRAQAGLAVVKGGGALWHLFYRCNL